MDYRQLVRSLAVGRVAVGLALVLVPSLAARGWVHDRQKPPDTLHATVSAGNAPVIEDYLTDLAAAVAEVAGTTLEDRSTNYATLE